MSSGSENIICTLGYHDVHGARHSVIREGLEHAGFTLRECVTKKPGLLSKYVDLWRQYHKNRQGSSALLVPFGGHYIMPLAWLLTRIQRKPIIFDVFISLYDTYVDDRQLVSPRSLKAHFLRFIDKLSCKLADVILIDTELHKRYFMKMYHVKSRKILVLPVGSRTDLFKPQEHSTMHDAFIVLFYGSFIPLHGIETILSAANLLQEEHPEIEITIIGKGQTYPALRTYAQSLELSNTRFLGPMPIEQLVDSMHQADVCLGIFGISDKANRVIPHKAYDALACAKPLITGKTKAAEHYFQHGENVILTKPGNEQELADAIVQLKNDPDLRERIAINGHRLFLRTCLPNTIVAPLVQWCKRNNIE